MDSTDEPERKRRHVSHGGSISHAIKKPAAFSDEKKVDAAMLRYQNQKLEQQLDVQKSEIEALENKLGQLKKMQASRDSSLSAVRTAWIALMEKVELLAARAPSMVKEGSSVCPCTKDGKNERVSPELILAHRLQESDATESSKSEMNDTELSALHPRCIQATENLSQAINAQQISRGKIFEALKDKLTENEYAQQKKSTYCQLKEEVEHLRRTVDTSVSKHKDVAKQARMWFKNVALAQVEIKQLSSELDESSAELKSTVAKVVAMKNQKDVSIGTKSKDGENMEKKPCQDPKALETAILEAKGLAMQRLKELEDSLRERGCLTQQLHETEESLRSGDYISKAHLFTLLVERIDGLRKEREQYQLILERLRVEIEQLKSQGKYVRLEVDVQDMADAGNMLDKEIIEREVQLQNCLTEKCNLNVKIDELSHTLDRQDEIMEFKVMVSTLEKEMYMMRQQLDKYKEATAGAEQLTAQVDSMSEQLEKKTTELKYYLEKVADQASEIKFLRDEVRLLQEREQEMKLILDMHSSESRDSRDIVELQEAESNAWSEVEKLKTALDDHGLELRVKVANEAEAACQQRLLMAETEISDVRCRLDDSRRMVMELKEAANLKNEEHEAYLAEIETIGQAYEDMQTQNQRLLQQISDRDGYNIQLVSDSIKAKQHHNHLNEENSALKKYIDHAISFMESQKQKALRLEEQANQHLDQLHKAVEDGSRNLSAFEAFRRRLRETEDECHSSRSRLEMTLKEVESCKINIGEVQAHVEKERHSKRKFLEDLSMRRSKIAADELQSVGSPLIDKLQNELKEYKTVLKCSVCLDRPKKVVITKCYHLFCSQCIKRNLEIRHRKCPACGVNFGQSDVRNVYI